MLQHIYETLELRVGTNLANQMSDQQLEEFEKFIDEGGDANQAQALQWLESNLPNYKQVVNDVFEALKVEVKEMAPQLLAASQQQPVMPQATPTDAAAVPAYQQPVQPQPMQQPQAPQAAPYDPYLQQQPAPAPQPQQPSQQQPYQYPTQQPPAGPSTPPPQYPQ